LTILHFIEACTRCSCCSGEKNHHRGPYKTREDAERRIAYYKATNSTFWPIASQYARRGHYAIHALEAEVIAKDRWIIEDRVFEIVPFIEVAEDGSILDNDLEYFTKEFP
jgi:hypothetical protein